MTLRQRLLMMLIVNPVRIICLSEWLKDIQKKYYFISANNPVYHFCVITCYN